MCSSGVDKVLILFDEQSRSDVIKNLVVTGLKHPHVINEYYLNKESIKLVKKGDFGLLIVSSRITEPLSIEAARIATTHPTATIIFIASVSDPQSDVEVKGQRELLAIGANLLIKPVTKNAFLVALNAADMAHIRLCTLKQKIEDEKVITRAKLVLMGVLCMSEEQAHKYLEKESMNRGVTRLETAYDVLRTYDY